MSKHWPTHCLCAALLVFGMVTLSTGKPPDLPAADKVNCKDNPAVPEYGATPGGAVELEPQEPEAFEPSECDCTPIDTFCPWLDALIRACAERVEVWFMDGSEQDAVQATASHTVQIVDPTQEHNLARLGIFEDANVKPTVMIYSETESADSVCQTVRTCCAKINTVVAACAEKCSGKPVRGKLVIVGRVRLKACSDQAQDPLCRTVRYGCACINRAVRMCAQETHAFLNPCNHGKCAERPGIVIYQVKADGATFFKWKGVAGKDCCGFTANCPVCRTMRSCCQNVRAAMHVCVQDFWACMEPSSDPSEAAEPASESCPKSTSPCPYLRDKKAAPQTSAAPVMPATPLDNLRKLQQARVLMHAAEQCQRDGKAEKARLIYAKVRALVPGSRFDMLAEKELETLAAIKDSTPDTSAGEEEEKPESKQPEKPSTCPFVQQKQAKRVMPATPPAFGNALDNLQKLEQAEKMLENAEECVRAGMTDQACALFRQIHLVCPGSRIDRVASQHCEALNARLAEARMLLADALRCVLTQRYDEAVAIYQKLEVVCPKSIYAQIAAEHQGMIQYLGLGQQPASGAEESSDAQPTCVAERVAELLEDCQRAIADGRYDEAAKLAKKAQKLDHDCVAANALVFKTHLLIQLQEKQNQGVRVKRATRGACVPLCPHMPPIDPAVVRDLERAVEAAQEARRQAEASQVEEAEPKDQQEDSPGDDAPQARNGISSDYVAMVMDMVHAGTGIEVAVVAGQLRTDYRCPNAFRVAKSAAENVLNAVCLLRPCEPTARRLNGVDLRLMVEPRVIICGEEEERATGLRGGVAP